MKYVHEVRSFIMWQPLFDKLLPLTSPTAVGSHDADLSGHRTISQHLPPPSRRPLPSVSRLTSALGARKPNKKNDLLLFKKIIDKDNWTARDFYV